MKGVYTATRAVTSATTGTIFEVVPASNKPIEILRCWLTGDQETAEQLDIVLARSTASGTGTATNITPGKTEISAADSATILQHGMSEPTLDSGYLAREWVPNAGGFYYVPTPEERPIVAGGSGDISFILRLNSVPTSAINLLCGITWRELG